MKIIRGLDQLSSQHKPSVVSIGNYDGVHLGHQQVIMTLLEQSVKLGAPSTVITFEPLAKEFFRPGSVMRLTSVDERAELLFALGVEQVLCIDFTAEFSAYSPSVFVQDVLIDGLGVKYLCVGDDFRFGKDRAGDFALLQTIGKRQGFTVTAHETFTVDHVRVSSGRIREALNMGDFVQAEKLLGRPYVIKGEVSKGQQLGRTLDYPTANVVLPDTILPINGVYAVTITFLNSDLQGEFMGVANVGKRPTVGGRENRLEVHLFDFDKDIYRQNISVKFHKKIRDEKKFASLDDLKIQIQKDAAHAKQLLFAFLEKK